MCLWATASSVFFLTTYHWQQKKTKPVLSKQIVTEHMYSSSSWKYKFKLLYSSITILCRSYTTTSQRQAFYTTTACLIMVLGNLISDFLIPAKLDTLQYAFRTNRSTYDAICTALLSARTNIDIFCIFYTIGLLLSDLKFSPFFLLFPPQ